MKNETITYKVRKWTTKINISKNAADINLRIKGWLLSHDKQYNKSNVERMEKIIEQEISAILLEIINETKSEGIDFLGIGEKFQAKGWATEDWDEKIKKLTVHVHVDAEILSGYGKKYGKK